jgi:hypothetical protein
MKLALRLIGLAAWAILAFGIVLITKGSKLAAERFMTHSIGPSRLAGQSDFIREVYDQPLGNDIEAVSRAMQILNLAGQSQQSKLIIKFFAHCNVQRLLGQEDACTRETMRSAMDKAKALAPDSQWPVNDDLAARLAHVLSFALATEQQMQDGIHSPGFWQYHQYSGPGVLSYDNGKHAFILLAVHNHERWEVARFHASLILRGSRRIELKCDWNPFPFGWPHPLSPDSEVIRVCEQPETLSLGELLPAVEQAQRDGSLSVRLKEFELKNHGVRITDDDDGGEHRFSLHPLAAFTTEFAPDTIPLTLSSKIQRELNQTNCQKLTSCPSLAQSASLAFYDYFQKYYRALPFLAGLLMGIGIGGLFARSLRYSGIVAAAGVVCTVVALMVAFQAAGNRPPGEARAWAEWGTMGLAVLCVGALLLWILGLFLGTALTTLIRGRANPANTRSEAT